MSQVVNDPQMKAMAAPKPEPEFNPGAATGAPPAATPARPPATNAAPPYQPSTDAETMDPEGPGVDAEGGYPAPGSTDEHAEAPPAAGASGLDQAYAAWNAAGQAYIQNVGKDPAGAQAAFQAAQQAFLEAQANAIESWGKGGATVPPTQTDAGAPEGTDAGAPNGTDSGAPPQKLTQKQIDDAVAEIKQLPDTSVKTMIEKLLALPATQRPAAIAGTFPAPELQAAFLTRLNEVYPKGLPAGVKEAFSSAASTDGSPQTADRKDKAAPADDKGDVEPADDDEDVPSAAAPPPAPAPKQPPAQPAA